MFIRLPRFPGIMNIEDKIEQPKAEKKTSLKRKLSAIAVAIGITGFLSCTSAYIYGGQRYKNLKQICNDLYAESLHKPLEGNIKNIKYNITSRDGILIMKIRDDNVEYAFIDENHDAWAEAFVLLEPTKKPPRQPNLEERSVYSNLLEYISLQNKRKPGVPV